MPLALPLLVSFAEVAGITIGAVATAAGIDLLSEKVESYMKENPEQSQKILAMIMPGQGLAQIFQNKSDKGDEEVSEEIDVEVEEKPKKLSGKEKGERIKAAIKRARAGRGNYSSPDAEGSAVDIRGSVIREVEDMGIADKDLKDKYDPNKPKFNWRRFTKKNYAYGGGVQSLFEPTPTYHQYHDMTTPITYGTMMDQRRGFNTGGWADDLTGQALAVYNSMTSGGHDDAAIQAALEAQGLWNQGSTPSANTEQVTGIINQNLGGGGGGIGELDLTFTEGAVPRGPKTDFNINPAAQLTGKGRLDPMGSDVDYFNTLSGPERFNFGFQMSDVPGQKGYEAPSKYFQEPSLIDKGIGSIKDFFSGLGTKKVRGTLGTRRKNQPRIPLPAAIASWSRSPFNKDSPNYNPMFEDQLNYLESLGAPGSYIGTDQTSGLLKYGPESVLAGQNVFSLFGSNNYENQLAKKRAWFENRLNKGKKISWNNYMKTLKEQKTLQYKQKDDKSTTVAKIISPKHHQDVSGGGVGGQGGQGDYTTPSIHRAPKSHTAPSKTGYMGPGGKHYAQGGLASLWQR